MTAAEHRSVPCPTCTARAGQPCHQIQKGKARGWRYKDVAHIHPARRKRWEREQERP